MNKIVRVISTGEIYLAMWYSFNLVDESIVYITDIKNGRVFEVHPNEIKIVKELTMIRK